MSAPPIPAALHGEVHPEVLDVLDGARARSWSTLDRARIESAFGRDPWGAARALATLSVEAGADRELGTWMFVARAVLAELGDDRALSGLCWRIAGQEAQRLEGDHRNEPLIAIAAAGLERPGAASVIDVSISVRRVLLERLSGEPTTAAALAARLAKGHGQLASGRMSAVSFPDPADGPAMPDLRWVADASAHAEGLQVLDTAAVIWHLAQREPTVAGALAAAGALDPLGAQVTDGGRMRVWRPAHGDRHIALRATPVEEGRLPPRPWVGPSQQGVEVGTTGDGAKVWIEYAISPDQRVLLTLVAPYSEPDVGRSAAAAEHGGTLLARVAAPTLDASSSRIRLAAGATAHGVAVLAADGDHAVAWVPGADQVWPLGTGGERAGTALAAGRLGPQRVVAVGGVDGGRAAVTMIETSSGTVVATVPSAAEVVDVALARVDGRDLLACVDADGLLALWDLADLRLVSSPTRAVSGVTAARFWPLDDQPALLLVDAADDVTAHRLELARVLDPVPQYHSDTVVDAAQRPPGRRDPLQRDPEAEALAEVITSAHVQPPLAIGVFGEWGEGKSYFLARLRKHVAMRSASSGGTEATCRNVRTVEFNAWHYAEADLWASLVAELYEQLAADEAPDGGHGGSAQAAMATVQAEVIRRRGLRERAEAAQHKLDEVTAQLRRHGWTGDDTDDGPVPFDELPAGTRAGLEQLLGTERARSYYEAQRGAPTVGRHLGHAAAAVVRSARTAVRRRPWVAVVASALVAGVAWLIASGAVAGLIGALAGIVAVVAALAEALLRTARRLQALGAAATRPVDGVARIAARSAGMEDEAITRLRIERDVLDAQVRQLQDQYARSVNAGQLAGLIEVRLQDGSYRSRLGLMTQIHRDFKVLADSLRRPPADVADGLHIDRIVVMIDDLDRCPPARVVQVLEAIQLLLALPLFVVVVAVDPRWLLRSLTAHYRQLLADPATPELHGEEPDGDLWRTTPMHYLEKIFQIPFTLPPLDHAAFERYVDDLVTLAGTTAEAGAGEEPSPPPAGSTAGPPPAAADRGAAGNGADPAATLVRPTDTTPVLPPPAEVDEVGLLVLDDAEAGMLRLLGPPLVATPRAGKRLINSYYLLLGLQGQEQRRSMIGPVPTPDGRSIVPHRAAMVLLAVLAGAPDHAPALFRSLHEAPPESAWTDFVEGLGGDSEGLQRHLRRVTREAQAADKPLPPLLGDWQPWVVPCGRLSFETGRVVVRLPDRSRQRPTTASPLAGPT